MYYIRLSILGALFACLSLEASAQALALFASGKKTGEVWPELDLFYKFNDKFRLVGTASATRGETGSNYTDGSLAINADYFAYPFIRNKFDTAMRGSYLWFRVGYAYKTSAPDAADKFQDDILRTEMNANFYLKHHLALTFRNRFDWKFSENGDFSGRYRPRIRLEHAFKTAYITTAPYIYAEYFLNFNGSSQNRTWFCLGAETKLTYVLNVDMYYVYQLSNQEVNNNLNAFGIIFKVYLPSGRHHKR